METFVIILLIQAFISGILASFVADEKKRSGGGWFCIGFLFGILGLIAVAGLPTRQLKTSKTESFTKKCPQCGEFIRKEALVCKHCHNSFNKDQLISELIVDIKSNSHKRQLEVLEILGRIGNGSILPELIEVLKKAVTKYEGAYYNDERAKELSIFSKALQLAEKFGGVSVSIELLAIIENKDISSDIIEPIVEILIKYRNPAVIPFLCEYLLSPNNYLESLAVQSLEKYGKEVLPELHEFEKKVNKKSAKKRIELAIERIKKLSCDDNYLPNNCYTGNDEKSTKR